MILSHYLIFYINDQKNMHLLIKLKNISVKLGNKLILSNISLSLFSNQILTLIGPNGAGKSTLIRVILGLIKPKIGKILRVYKLRVGYVPQSIDFNTLFPITVVRFMQCSKITRKEVIRKSLKRVGVLHLENIQLQKLSKGEIQKVLLARSILNKPQLLVLDEPTQGVDIIGQNFLYKFINELRRELKCAVLIVSHDLNLVMKKTDEVLCLNQHICCSGTPDVILKNKKFISMFGSIGMKELALYFHIHDHYHDQN